MDITHNGCVTRGEYAWENKFQRDRFYLADFLANVDIAGHPKIDLLKSPISHKANERDIDNARTACWKHCPASTL